jgi:hypothetical protein
MDYIVWLKVSGIELKMLHSQHIYTSLRIQVSLPPACLLGLAEIISSTLKMEAICSSETSFATQQTTRRHIPEDDTLHNHRSESLKSYILYHCIFIIIVITFTCYLYWLFLFLCPLPSYITQSDSRRTLR